MRIGIDLRLPFYQMGGISQYAIHLLTALAQLDSENAYTVYHSRKDNRDFTPKAVNFGRKTLYTPCHHKYEKYALSAELAAALSKAHQNYDIWHSPDFIPPIRGGKRHVITVHDLNFLYYPEYLTDESRRYYNDQIQWAVDRAAAISADSHATAKDLVDKLNVAPAKISTIHLAANPLYEQAFSEDEVTATLKKHHLERGYILFVGTLEPRKNLPTVLKAYQKIKADVGVPLVIIGRKGWLWEGIFEQIEALGLSDDVRHLEGIFDEELAKMYRGAGVLVQPSHYEGFGLPPLEAMWCGCPVISSDRASLPEIVGDAGVLLDADDVEAWAATIAAVLSDPAKAAAMRAAGKVQAATFNWQLAAEATLNLYNRAVAS